MPYLNHRTPEEEDRYACSFIFLLSAICMGLMATGAAVWEGIKFAWRYFAG